MVILGFVTDINYQNSALPKLTLAPIIKGVKTAYQRLLAPGSDYYAQLEADIKSCQATHGKKVLLSLGGGGSQLVLRAEQEATQFANWLWKLFGPVTPATTRGNEYVNGLRPFGTSVVDGFDLAKLDSSPNNWGTFAARMCMNFLHTCPSSTIFLQPRGVPRQNPRFPLDTSHRPTSSGRGSSGVRLDGVNLGVTTSSRQFFNRPASSPKASAPLGGSNTAIAGTKFLIGIPAWAEAALSAYTKLGGAQAAGALAIQL